MANKPQLKLSTSMRRTVCLMARLGVNELEKRALTDAHPDANFWCDEWNNTFKVHGYHTDKYIVGIQNAHNHYSLEILKEVIVGYRLIERIGLHTVKNELFEFSSNGLDKIRFGEDGTYSVDYLNQCLNIYMLYEATRLSLSL